MQYFCLANNLGVLTYLNYLAEDSCLKTLARKWKTSLARVRKKLNIGSTWSISYINKGKTQYEPWEVYSWDKIKKKWVIIRGIRILPLIDLYSEVARI
ncbi:hypothetical protein OC726_02135 [Candidatus Phytoplasma aurantifolia]|uniref:Domain X domain-containing protein n=1 Tax=Candidatus Phytoplasma citri TaxID=180978 RepID=A0ABU8ZRP4_9MOLU|nr:hypothetical protein [Candidatus Phytoplasma aurantifolia]